MNKVKLTSYILIFAFVTNVFGAKLFFPDDPTYNKLLGEFSEQATTPTMHLPQKNGTSTKIVENRISDNISTAGKKETSLNATSTDSSINIERENITSLSNLISDNINTFGLKISNASDENNKDTKIFSPINIAEALMLVWLGSNSQTFNEIADVLGFQNKSFDIYNHSQSLHEQFGRMLQSLESKTKEEPQLTTASALFVQDGFPIGQKYSEIVKNVYKSNVTHLDFAHKNVEAQKYINDWVSNNTNELINEILSTPPAPTTKIILTTALYFKGLWEYPFLKEFTYRGEFYPNGKADVSNFMMVDFMANFNVFKYAYNKHLNSEVLCLPYKGGTASMYIIAPKKSSMQKIQEIEKNLTTSVIDNLIKDLKPVELGLIMPKMKFESTISLSSILQKLGLKSLFDPNTAGLNVLSPGFTFPNNTEQTIDEIRNQVQTENSSLYVEEIIHKVFISIDELGTEAAAITDLLIPRGGMKKVSLNQPFIFFIRHHDTNLNLFMSSVYVPVPNFK